MTSAPGAPSSRREVGCASLRLPRRLPCSMSGADLVTEPITRVPGMAERAGGGDVPPPRTAAYYCLPAVGDTDGWAALLRPVTGQLELIQGTSQRGCVRWPATGRPRLRSVDVWVHCGVLYRPRRRRGVAASTAPETDKAPRALETDRHWRYFPLGRDEPDASAPPRVAVDVSPAEPARGLAAPAGGWVLTLTAAAGPSLCFWAASEADAVTWRRQLRMRAAPMAIIWAVGGRVAAGVGGDGSGGSRMGSSSSSGSGSGGRGGSTPDLPEMARCVLTLARLFMRFRQLCANDVLAGAAGVATALTRDEAYNLAVASGPLVGVAFSTIGFGLRVFSAARSVLGAADVVSAQLHKLKKVLSRHILPALKYLPVHGVSDVADLIRLLGCLVVHVEALVGELHHAVLSRGRRVHLALSATWVDETVERNFVDRLSLCKAKADELRELVQMAHLLEVGPRATALRKARDGLPRQPRVAVIDWADSELPAVRLYTAVMDDATYSSVAVGVHGMGGVGKTFACRLVAQKVMDGAAGKKRFPGGVHWVQLSQEVTRNDVLERMRLLVTTLTDEPCEKIDADEVLEQLRHALAARACLVVVDDVWEPAWATLFFNAFACDDSDAEGGASSSLLLSTRDRSIATRACVRRPVEFGTLPPAASEAVLLAHAERGAGAADGGREKTDERVAEAVSLCGGHALALSVMGSLVYACGWAMAVEQVGRCLGHLLPLHLRHDGSVSGAYDSLQACLRASEQALGNEEASGLWWRKYFHALCVIRTKEWLPWTALAALWDLDGREDVSVIASGLQSRSLVLLRDVNPGETLCLGVHDLVVEYLRRVDVVSRADREAFHVQLVGGYCRRNGILTSGTPVEVDGKRVTVRPLWELPLDSYVEFVLPHLLAAGGATEEARALDTVPRFRIWVLEGLCAASERRLQATKRERAALQGIHAHLLGEVRIHERNM